MEESKQIIVKNEEQLFDAISCLIEESRRQVAKAVNTTMVYTYYGVGQYIVEFEQGGKERAAYGKEVLKRLSARLTEKYGKGWSVETLTKCRKFFMVYSIWSPVETKSINSFFLGLITKLLCVRIIRKQEDFMKLKLTIRIGVNASFKDKLQVASTSGLPSVATRMK